VGGDVFLHACNRQDIKAQAVFTSSNINAYLSLKRAGFAFFQIVHILSKMIQNLVYFVRYIIL